MAKNAESKTSASSAETNQSVVSNDDASEAEGHNPSAVANATEHPVDFEGREKTPKSGKEVASPSNNETLHYGRRTSIETTADHESPAAPPLPEETAPPLPEEEPPAVSGQDDGWAPVWEETAQAFYFYNRFTGATQWTNPRVPDPPQPEMSVDEDSTAAHAQIEETSVASRPAGGYDPSVHGDYDPNAWYAQSSIPEESTGQPPDPTAMYAATGAFNRFTGRWQAETLTPENFNDDNKSRRQMNAFFDVDAAANSHDGRSLKAERSGKKLSKSELKQFKEKRKAKKEEKRRAWLKD